MVQPEIFAAATLLKIQIFVFPCQTRSQEYHWLCYKPLGSGYSISKCPTSVQKLWKLTPLTNYHIELIHSFLIIIVGTENIHVTLKCVCRV